jgi:hypothetical protein
MAPPLKLARVIYRNIPQGQIKVATFIFGISPATATWIVVVPD